MERPVDDLLRRGEIDAAAEIVAAEPDRRHPQPRKPEISLFHPLVPDLSLPQYRCPAPEREDGAGR